MSDHGINTTYKSGADYGAHWITVGADDEQTWHERNQAVNDSIAAASAKTAEMIRALKVLEEQLPGVQQVATEPAPGVTTLPTAAAAPVQQPAAPAAAQVPDSGPGAHGLKFWTIPDPKNAQYKLLLFSWDYIADAAVRNGIAAALKASNPQTYAKPFDTDSSPWVWGAKSNAEQAIRAIFAQHGVS